MKLAIELGTRIGKPRILFPIKLKVNKATSFCKKLFGSLTIEMFLSPRFYFLNKCLQKVYRFMKSFTLIFKFRYNPVTAEILNSYVSDND